MTTILLIVRKKDVMAEVSKTTAYIGAKATGDETAYYRLSTSKGDEEMLERFWTEACAAATNSLKHWISTAASTSGTGIPATDEEDYTLSLDMPSNFNAALADTMQGELANYALQSVLSKWLALAGSDAAEQYATLATATMAGIIQMGYTRGRPYKTEPCCTPHITADGEAVIVQTKQRLIYDIANLAYVSGDVLGEDAQHVTHLVQEITEDGNADRVARVLDMAHEECVNALYPYAKEELPEEQIYSDDAPLQRSVYAIALKLPEGFSQTTVRLLQNYIHEYMVCRALQDWFAIVYPAGSEVWAGKTELVRDKMRTILLARTGRIRRKMKPF